MECEALGQGISQRLVRDALDGLLPEPLSDVLGREADQRVRVAELLNELDERATLRTWARLVTRRTESR
jgi:hypothetical protein